MASCRQCADGAPFFIGNFGEGFVQHFSVHGSIPHHERKNRMVCILKSVHPYEQQLPPPSLPSLRSCSHSLIMPEAQPTPLSTVMAVTGQFRAHAPHSMQASLSRREAFFSASVNTWW